MSELYQIACVTIDDKEGSDYKDRIKKALLDAGFTIAENLYETAIYVLVDKEDIE